MCIINDVLEGGARQVVNDSIGNRITALFLLLNGINDLLPPLLFNTADPALLMRCPRLPITVVFAILASPTHFLQWLAALRLSMSVWCR